MRTVLHGASHSPVSEINYYYVLNWQFEYCIVNLIVNSGLVLDKMCLGGAYTCDKTKS